MAMSLVSQHITTKSSYLVSVILIMIMITSAVLALYGIVPLNISCILL